MSQEKVLLATFQLDRDARAWWEAANRQLPNINIEWDKFLELFNTKYFSERIREKKANEFVNLKQRMMSVAEYEVQFERLAQYAPHLVSTEKMKAKRFLEGLRPVFWEKLAPLDIVVYSDMVLRAQLVEDTMELLEKIYKKKVLKRERATHSNDNKERNTVDSKRMKGEVKQKEVCEFFEKPGHQVDKCWKKLDRCLRCGSQQHRVIDCPTKKNQTPCQGRLQALVDMNHANEGGQGIITTPLL
ncbi:hypothetical protein Taro_050144 [Colocasia esculenta]|uniref:Retrotransposon gag domain-containing protein n=1 Tax=Colocasia esculenta TaxID=4460 RepID=A0A843XCM9_COLES|nr:hypothetical protein [Colocasia esculenta]